MIALTSKQILTILDCNQPIDDVTINNVSTDSRNVNSSSLFIAIKGENFDGHDFIQDVLEKGAALVISQKEIPNINSSKIIIVNDTLKALGKIAHYNRMQYKGTLIALTGSSGKTTTKEELKHTLSAFAPTYATSGNFNNHIGVPRSLLDLDMNSKFAIIEMGMSALGEISYLTSLASPDIAIVTNVYPMHIEFLKTTQNIAIAKSEIFEGLSPLGLAIYNADSLHADIIKNTALKYTNNIHAYSKETYQHIKLNLKDTGQHNYYNAWVVLSVIKALNLDIDTAISAINKFETPAGRGKKHQLNINNNNITLIDDSYSGQPDAVKLAIKSLANIKTSGRKIALLGKMAELGDYSKTAHIEVGQTLKENNIDIVIGICEETKDILAQLSPSTKQYYFPSIEGVLDFLTNNILQNNDVILIKGAHYSSQVFKIANTLKEKYEK